MFCIKMARKLAGRLVAVAAFAATMAAGAMGGLGAPAVSAATHEVARPAIATPAGLTWHAIKLVNGWQSAASAGSTGNPRWAVSNGIVYLAGTLHGTSSAEVFAELPRAARPARAVDIGVYTFKGVPGELELNPDGAAGVWSTNQGYAEQFTSLAGISFPARATTRSNLNLLHGWKPGPSGWGTGYPAYSVVDGVVHLSGAMRQPGGTNSIFARLPLAVRPANVLYITVDTGNDAAGAIQIDPNGVMYAYDGGAQLFTSLDGVSYPLHSVAAHKITLLHGWKSRQGSYDTGSPAYSVRKGVVYLSGSLHQPAGTNSEIGILPPADRPANNLYFTTYANDGSVGALQIAPDGGMWLGSAPQSNVETFASLASISFPLKS